MRWIILCSGLFWRIQRILIHSLGWMPPAFSGGGIPPHRLSHWGGRGKAQQWTDGASARAWAGYQGNSGSTCWRPLGHGIEHASDLSYLKGKMDKTYIHHFPLPFGESCSQGQPTCPACIWSHPRDQRKPSGRQWLMFALRSCQHAGQQWVPRGSGQDTRNLHYNVWSSDCRDYNLIGKLIISTFIEPMSVFN